jgi:hypothetical protein
VATHAASVRGAATGFGDLIATGLVRPAIRSVVAARLAIATVFVSYALSVIFGIVMATSGNADAIAQRDAVVGAAGSSAITIANRSGDHVRAALLDFSSNLVAGGLTSTAFGTSVVGLYPVVAYRGWIGGIVVLDGEHRSRLADPASALYYVVTLVLQLVPYSIAGGVGVRLGVGAWAQLRSKTATATWLGLPTDRLRDALLAYVVIAPLFLIASLWEFLVRV